MNTRIITSLTLLVIAFVVGILLLIDTPADETTTSVIVKGKDLAAARAAVVSVGGEITHELGIIRSVGAKLTASQLEAIRGIDGLKLHEDRSVSTAGTCSVSGTGFFRFDGNKLMWDLENSASGTATISRIELTWPSVNRMLKKVKLDGSEIYNIATSPSSAVIASGWKGNLGDRTIDPADTVELKLEFEGDAVIDPTQYSVRVVFAEGCSIDFEPAPACAVFGDASLAFDGNKLLWNLENAGSATATISQVDVTWPTANSTLKKLKLDGNEFYNIETTPPSMTVTSGWKGDLDDRSLAPGDYLEFKIEFDQDAVIDHGQYSIGIGFAGGCSASFGVPEPTPTPTPTLTPPPDPTPTPTPTPPPAPTLDHNVRDEFNTAVSVSYTHLRAHET